MFLETLSNLPGVSGDETRVRRAIVEILQDQPLVLQCDTMGNLYVRKKGSARDSRIMLTAHMDEVGLMVVAVEKSGHLKFKPVGSIDSRVLAAKRVKVGPDAIPGVIGVKAVHLQKPGERRKPFTEDQLSIDIGASSREEALKYVRVGDYVTFDSTFTAVGEGYFRGKAFDDRVGCAVLLELLLDPDTPPFDAVFTVQEEIGSRGALVAAYKLQPQRALVLEGTAAADTPGIESEQSSTVLGAGPAISIMDSSVIVDREMLRELVHTAEAAGIPYQYRRFTGASTDAGAIALSREGVKAAVVSVPCRYIHSPHGLLKESDFAHTVALVKNWLQGVG